LENFAKLSKPQNRRRKKKKKNLVGRLLVACALMCVYIYTPIYAYMTHVHISMYTWFVSISMYIWNHHDDVDAYSIGLKIGPLLLNHMILWKQSGYEFNHTMLHSIPHTLRIFSFRVMPQEKGACAYSRITPLWGRYPCVKH